MYTMESENLDRLRQDGIQTSRGKMLCNGCDERKVSASTAKDIAKCWGCGKFWSVSDTIASGDHDWATVLLNRLVELMQDYLVESAGPKDWFRKRRLQPVAVAMSTTGSSDRWQHAFAETPCSVSAGAKIGHRAPRERRSAAE